MKIIERLDAEVIARHEQRGNRSAKIADGEGEHSVQALYAVRAFFLVKMDDHFGVGVGREAVPFAFEFMAKVSEVVNLAVIGDPDGAVFVAHRHVTERRQIENSQAAAAQSNIGAVGELAIPEAEVVGAAMRLHLRHPRQGLSISAVHHAANAAHSRLFPLRLFFALRLQFVNLGFGMKHLDGLKPAVDQAWNAVHKS